MKDLSLDKPAGVLIKTTLVDFPGLIAGSFFLKGCNLRCPYCYNKGLVDNSDSENSLNSINDLFSHLEKRQGILHGVVISGGEPLINPYTPIIIKKAKSLGYKVKLDTNGILPDELEAFIENPELKPDFISMDIKTTPENYCKIIANPKSKYYGNPEYFKNVITRSIKLLEKLSPTSKEFRTVLVPMLISDNDIINIAKILPKDASWRLAQFQNNNCLNPLYENILPYTDNEINKLVNLAKTLIIDTQLR